MTKTFKNQAEAIATLAPLFKAGRIDTFRPVTTFGRTTVKVWSNGWFTLTEAKFAELVA